MRSGSWFVRIGEGVQDSHRVGLGLTEVASTAVMHRKAAASSLSPSKPPAAVHLKTRATMLRCMFWHTPLSGAGSTFRPVSS
jgi:hypothetical protein